MTPFDRRAFLALGLGSLAAATACGGQSAAPAVPPSQTFEEWARSRRAPYFIAHRGAGTIIPEHTLPGYRRALDWGAEALELSVVISSDGVLYCHHDVELDRTTTLTGPTFEADSDDLDRAGARIPRLGPAWNGENMPAIPRLEKVLDAVGRKIICAEAKDDRAFDPMMALLEERDLMPQTMLKVGYTSSRIEGAKKAGLPVFAYFGEARTVTATALDELAAKLSESDAIVLPARSSATELLTAKQIEAATATGIPIWVYPIHRRSEVSYFSALGVEGIVTPALGYVSGALQPQTRDAFGSRALAPGLTTRDPYSDWDAVGWDTADAVELIGHGARSIMLGDLCPVAAPDRPYQLDLEVKIAAGAMAATDGFYVAFGCPDDLYHQRGVPGYQLVLRGDGVLVLTVTGTDGKPRSLASSPASPAMTKGDWTRLSIRVSPDSITATRDGGVSLSASDQTLRGGYLHIGRTAGSAELAVRSIAVS